MGSAYEFISILCLPLAKLVNRSSYLFQCYGFSWWCGLGYDGCKDLPAVPSCSRFCRCHSLLSSIVNLAMATTYHVEDYGGWSIASSDLESTGKPSVHEVLNLKLTMVSRFILPTNAISCPSLHLLIHPCARRTTLRLQPRKS